MLPGPDEIISCPKCGKLARSRTLLSGKTNGGVWFSNGDSEFPMLPRSPEVVRCGGCGAAYFREDAALVGQLEFRKAGPAAWQEAPEIEEPTEAQYYDAIDGGIAAPESDREVQVRIFAWWRHRRRFSEFLEMSRDALAKSFEPPGQRYHENLRSLLALLKTNEDAELLLRAEAYRHLGDFEDAKACLEQVKSPRLSHQVESLRKWCDEKDVRLQSF